MSAAPNQAALIPQELQSLFDASFTRSCELLAEYVARLSLQIFRSTGLDRACAGGATVDEAMAHAGLAPQIAAIPSAWLLAMLATRGWIDCATLADGRPRYTSARALPFLDPAEIAALQETHDASCLPSYRIAAIAAEHYPAVLRGELSGEEAVFAPARISAWLDYFSNANPSYAIANAIGAIAAARAFSRGGGSILELGGGLGSGAEALLAHLHESGATFDAYRFTEISPQFLRRAKKSLAAKYPDRNISFAWLDIDRPFAASGVESGTYRLIYGVNVLHVAHDLAATLAEIRTALAPGGALVIAECVRPFAGQPIYVELVFNLLAAFRDPVLVPTWRPNGGFLTPEQWCAALSANGFTDVALYPDIIALRETYPEFVIASLTARKA
jgi:SAM-dependent methyltransferase